MQVSLTNKDFYFIVSLTDFFAAPFVVGKKNATLIRSLDFF